MFEDVLTTVFAGVGGVFFGAIVGFLAASFTNIMWKAKFMRQNMKREVFIVRFLNKDKHSMREFICDVNDDVKLLGNKVVIFEKGRIWRTSAENVQLFDKGYKVVNKKDEMTGMEVPPNKDDGFYLEDAKNTKAIQWVQEVPVIHIDDESFRPIEFQGVDTSKDTPAETMASLIETYINIQVAKRLARKKQDILLLILLAGFGISIYMVFDLTGKVGKLQGNIADLTALVASMKEEQEPPIIPGQSVVIQQMPVSNPSVIPYGVLSTTDT